MLKKSVLIFISFFNFNILTTIDLNIVGFILSSDGLGRIPLLIIDCLKDYDLKINFIPTRKINLISPDTSLAIQRILNNDSSKIGNVALYTDILSYPGESHYKFIPQNCYIKIAYSMLESSEIPKQWSSILNNYFDAVVVPDKWLIDVYKKSGVKIPIFDLALPIKLEDFLNKTTKNNANFPFVFGNTCALEDRKNYIRLIEAFNRAFGNSSEVVLKINARRSDGFFEILRKKVDELGLKNVQLTVKVLSHQEYINFMQSFDCFVSLSRGEGFAIPPREALALGIPVIISDNTAHSTICKTGLVKPVDSNIIVPAIYSVFGGKQIGFNFDCTVEDSSQALKDVYNNYSMYLKKAVQGREWVKQYLKDNIQKKYLSLAKPEKIIFGDKNIITDNYIVTDSKSLYEKYEKIINQNISKKFEQKCLDSLINNYFLNYSLIKKHLNKYLNSFFNFYFNKSFYVDDLKEIDFVDFNLSMRFGAYKMNNKLIYDESEIKEKLKLFKNLYEKNINSNLTYNPKIPKIIHQIWLGGKLPNEFKKITEKWLKLHPDWEYKLWDDVNIKELFPLFNQKYFNESVNLAEKSDILRYEILYRFGGVYIDTDYECFKNFDFLLHKYNFFVGIQPLDAGPYDIGNAIIGSSINHPIMKHTIQTICDYRNEKLIINKTGPGHITRSFNFVIKFYNDSIIALPIGYLYPLGYFQRHNLKDPHHCLSKESLGIHYWSGTWYLKN